MNKKTRIFWIASGLAVAGTVSVAQAAKPSPTAQERKVLIEKVTKNQRNFKQPRTMAEAAASQVRLANGAVAVAVPTELWNNLSVTTDAPGKLQMHESDGTSAPATSISKGLENE